MTCIFAKGRKSDTYQDGVHETHSALSGFDALLVDAVKHAGPYGRRCRCAADELRSAVQEDNDVVAAVAACQLLFREK